MARSPVVLPSPSLAASLLQVSPSRLVSDGQLFGLLFESLCIHDLAVYASALSGATADPLHYYRDSDGLEVDAVVVGAGEYARFDKDLGVHVLPITCLGA